MTNAQIQLLKKLIRAVRIADEQNCLEFELVEVGWINGVNPRTAETLYQAGLVEYELPHWANEFTNPHIRLKRMKELQ